MNNPHERFERVRSAIAKAALLAGRAPAAVTLVAVSKNRTAEEILPLLAAGHRDFGESRVQEAAAKWPELRRLYPDVRLHGIGRLQSNKAAEAIELFSTIHSVDRHSLLESLVAAATKTGRGPSVFVQVNIGDEEQKGGCAFAEVPRLVTDVRASPLPLAGLMGIPPLGVEPGPYFALLAKLAVKNAVEGLSMGMSGDFPAAIMLGATVIRVGSALFEDA